MKPLAIAGAGLGAALFSLVVLSGCSASTQAPAQGPSSGARQPPPQVQGGEGDPAPPPGGARIANPASENCVEKGGKVEIHSVPAGQFGVCVFPDGSRCEEWHLFRGQCAPGECRDEDGLCGEDGE